MIDYGFLPDFPPAVTRELGQIEQEASKNEPSGKDLRHLPWASIDNDDSRDLDQVTLAEALTENQAKVYVAISDVDGLVKKDSAIDKHARFNTTSVYTAGEIFPMLPEKLSTDLTSLKEGADRQAMVVEMVISASGEVLSSDIYPAVVQNKAHLTYNQVAAFLDTRTSKGSLIPPEVAKNLRLQARIAANLRTQRYKRGALDFKTIQTQTIFTDDHIGSVQEEEPNRAKELIEDFMIAANDVTARFLHARHLPAIRRVVRSPKRWDRIVQVAAQYGFKLPPAPDSGALERFLAARRTADPVSFPDLSLIIIKLLGQGEYYAEQPGENAPGHFSLAVRDYSHSTAPNRRYSDLVTQRLLKAALGTERRQYTLASLVAIAQRCTEQEDQANKVERLVTKSAGAMLLSGSLGNIFDAVCTGAAEKGTWVRIFKPPVEGRLVEGFQGVDVGDRLEVKLVSTDVDKGYIDFARA